MALTMTVGEGQDTAAVMLAGRVMKEALLVTGHAHDERRKTNVVRMNILEREQPGGRTLCQVGRFAEYRVAAGQLPGALRPAHVCIERVASDFDIRSAGIRLMPFGNYRRLDVNSLVCRFDTCTFLECV